ncbi:3-alpha,7-alpha,12-alpha-trihydroxy-5-beta-cholest-24-enoyl-CoA hydratase [Sphingomonas sp. Leaf412]|nr:3-alpha,7-alpha,12-alpha-trihydroxy-5-beta-cholest-24-enoyl-CoA hydratase [Sphingomonas sp. Leaf412]
MALRETDKAFSYDDTLTLLYALGIGMGRDPLDPRELKFVYEGAGFVAMPTLAVVVARSMLARTLPIDKAMLLHGEQTLTIHRPLPTAAHLLADTRITKILDKGEGKGALIYSETAARLAADDAPLFTIGMTLVARGDGGFGGPAGPTTALHDVPNRAPDHVHVTDTRADQALLYRLTGDRNPLHADPALATRAGFPAPILHGLATYGIACRAVMAVAADYDPARIAGFDVRFTSPVFPGDRIATDVWIDGGVASFRCCVPDRGVTVINNGRCLLTPR